ncbi:hypothetical protein PGH26_12565 [Sporosarcina jeotgali]|uniref:Polymerase nucleotidyl transferase domain-containing protein n=1 Tax=Sporosarcina jeotgali TaxID=3020056 RepID=A0ABZ0KV21_9BACL|nr:hypothetical protein [Sporosarcina sp. B2O-1]WOV83703.1 hypothetical protein PGH26_12565 [Sporosarcina sp. B2O-1]
MFSSQERDDYFDRTLTMIHSVAAVEGIVQLGSGVTGYKDAYSDIDLMVCIAKENDTQTAKEQIYQALLTCSKIIVRLARSRFFWIRMYPVQ